MSKNLADKYQRIIDDIDSDKPDSYCETDRKFLEKIVDII